MSVFSNNLLLGAGGQSTGPASFDPTLIGNSVWLDGSADFLKQTFGSASNQKRFVLGTWIQRNSISSGTLQTIFATGADGSNGFFFQYQNTTSSRDDRINIYNISGGSLDWNIQTSARFRDSAYYHILLSYESAAGTSTDRVQIYINGVLQTSLETTSYPSLSFDCDWGAAQSHCIGNNDHNTSAPLPAYLTQTIYLDGQSIQNGDVAITDFLDAFTFGTNGSQFSPKADADIAALATTAGGNSFCLDFADSTNLGASISSIDNSVGSGATMPGTTGTNIGNMTSNGGLAAAFDGTNHTSSGTSANIGGTEGYVGKNWNGRSTIIDSVSIFPPDTYTGKFFRGSSEGQLRLYGSNSAPSSGTDGTLLADSGVISTTGYSSSTPFTFATVDITTTTAYTYHWMTLTDTVSGDIYVGQLDWTATKVFNDFTPTSMSSTNQSTNTPSLVYPKISNIGTPSGDAAANYTMGLGSNRMVYSGANQTGKGLISPTLIQPDDPKIYWEYYVETGSVSGNGGRLGNGIAIPQFNVSVNGFYGAGGESAFFYRGTMYDNGATSVSGFTVAQAGDIQQMAFEPSTGKVWIGVEGTWRNGAGTSGTTLDESNPDDQLTVQDYIFTMGAARSTDIGVMNFGDNPTMSGNITAGGNADENGYGNFKYAVPSGFLAPNSANLTAPDYQGIDYFTSTLYQGNGTGQRVGDFVPFTDAYTVANSAMFQHDEVRALSRTIGTPSSTGGKKGTWSTWYKTANIDTDNIFFDTGTTATNRFSLQMDASGQIGFVYGAGTYILKTNADLKGGDLWRNLVLKVDTSLATAADRAIMYIDGVEVTSFATDNRASLPQDSELGYMDSGATQFVGSYNGVSANQWDGYLAETIFLDDQFLSADSFGQLDTSTNKWVPKDISGLTLGDQGFYLEYGGNFGTGNGAGDSTGNSNNLTEIGTWTTSDQFIDTPSKNFAVWDGGRKDGNTLSEGNLKATGDSGSDWDNALGTLYASSGKFYFEIERDSDTGGTDRFRAGVVLNSYPSATSLDGRADGWGISENGNKLGGGISAASYGDSTTTGDYIGVALDMDRNAIYFSKNGTWMNSASASGIADGSDITKAAFTNVIGNVTPFLQSYDAQVATLRTASGRWEGTAPTGFSELNQDNLDDTASKITALAWIKNRDAADDNIWMDRVIGTGGYLSTTQNDSGTAATAYGDGGTDVLTANTNAVQRFLQRGVQIGSDENVNTANESYVLWQWLLGDSATTGSSITTGSPSLATTGIVSDANHFSIVQYTGNGTDNATFAHGLGSTPNLVMIKRRSGTALNSDWVMHVVGLGTENYIYPHYRIALSSGAGPNGMVPDADLVEISTGVATNTSGQTHMAYSFKNTPGLCKIGTYIGNSSANGTYVSTGFRPSWLWIFNTTLTSADAERPIIDTARYRFNGTTTAGGLNGGINFSDQRAAEEAQSTSLGGNPAIDILSEGFKLRANDSTINTGTTYMYICMADIAGNGTLPPVYGR